MKIISLIIGNTYINRRNPDEQDNKKRFVSLLLALIMLIGIFVVPMAAFAENGSDTAGNFDEFIVNLKDLENMRTVMRGIMPKMQLVLL